MPGILVAHAGLAAELRTTAESIVGPAPDLVTLSNAGTSPESLEADIGRALDETGSGTIVLVDLAGGSCHTAALRAARGRSEVYIVAGVNLSAVLVYLQKRDELTPADLVDYILDRGRSGFKATVPGGVS